MWLDGGSRHADNVQHDQAEVKTVMTLGNSTAQLRILWN